MMAEQLEIKQVVLRDVHLERKLIVLKEILCVKSKEVYSVLKLKD